MSRTDRPRWKRSSSSGRSTSGSSRKACWRRRMPRGAPPATARPRLDRGRRPPPGRRRSRAPRSGPRTSRQARRQVAERLGMRAGGPAFQHGDRLLAAVPVTGHQPIEGNGDGAEPLGLGRGAPLPEAMVSPVQEDALDDDGQVGPERAAAGEGGQRRVAALHQVEVDVLGEVLGVLRRQAAGPADRARYSRMGEGCRRREAPPSLYGRVVRLTFPAQPAARRAVSPCPVLGPLVANKSEYWRPP